MLGAALIATGVVTGLIVTFSVAIMPNLAGVDDRTFVLISQRFNQNPVFPLTFTVALALTALAPLLQRRRTYEAPSQQRGPRTPTPTTRSRGG